MRPAPSLGPTTESPIYDDLLSEAALPLDAAWPDCPISNWMLFDVWRQHGLETIPASPPLYRYFIRVVDPQAPGIGDRVVGVNDQEWLDIHFNSFNPVGNI